jgi:multidrug transporter EmrE-like cation transporter
MREAMFLVLAAVLEVGGDALVRWGLRGKQWTGLALGAVVLFSYGLSVNLPKWDFGRLMGVYIAVFFVVSQAISVAFFREKISMPIVVGGFLIIAGGILIAVWRVPEGA